MNGFAALYIGIALSTIVITIELHNIVDAIKELTKELKKKKQS